MVAEPRGRGIWVGLGVFVVLAGGFSLLVTLPLGMSSDGCTTYDRRFKCSSAGQLVVPGLPWLGIVLGVLVAGIGIALARKRKPAPAVGLAGAFVSYAVTVVIAMSLAAADPVPPDPAQVTAVYDQLVTRPDFDTMVTRDRQLAIDIEALLGPARWSPPAGEGRGVCDPPLGIVGVDGGQSMLLASVDGTVTADQLASVRALVTGRGFTPVPTAEPAVTRYRDGYGGEVYLSVQPRLYLQVSTGCFLTSSAKQRGAPSSGP